MSVLMKGWVLTLRMRCCSLETWHRDSFEKAGIHECLKLYILLNQVLSLRSCSSNSACHPCSKSFSSSLEFQIKELNFNLSSSSLTISNDTLKWEHVESVKNHNHWISPEYIKANDNIIIECIIIILYTITQCRNTC